MGFDLQVLQRRKLFAAIPIEIGFTTEIPQARKVNQRNWLWAWGGLIRFKSGIHCVNLYAPGQGLSP